MVNFPLFETVLVQIDIRPLDRRVKVFYFKISKTLKYEILKHKKTNNLLRKSKLAQLSKLNSSGL